MPLKSVISRFHGLSDNLKGISLLVVSAALFSVMATLIKILGQNLHIFQILFIRQLTMSTILLPLLASGFPGILRTAQPSLQLLRIALALGGMLFGFTAIIHMPLADATALGFAKSFFVTVFAILVLNESVGPRRWMAVVLGFIGVAIMLRPGSDAFTIYGVMAVAGAACAGAVMVIIRLMSRRDGPTTILAWQAIGVGAIITVPALYYWTWPTPFEWALLAAMGFTSYAAQMTNIMSYRWGEASLLASLDYVRLLYATLLGWLIFSTLPDRSTWIGATIIVLASLYTVVREHRRRRELTRSPHGRGFSQ